MSEFVPSTSPSDELVIKFSTTAFDGSKQAPTARESPHSLFCRANQHFKTSHRAGSKLEGIGVDCVFLKNVIFTNFANMRCESLQRIVRQVSR